MPKFLVAQFFSVGGTQGVPPISQDPETFIHSTLGGNGEKDRAPSALEKQQDSFFGSEFPC